MGILDIILIICFVPGIVQGISKGFVSEALSIVSIVAGAWLASRFSATACSWLQQYLQIDSKVLNIIVYIIIVVITILLLYWIGQLITRVVKVAMLGWLNAILGLLLSLLKTALILGLLIMLFDSINNAIHLVPGDKLANASVYMGLKKLASGVFPYLKALFSHV